MKNLYQAINFLDPQIRILDPVILKERMKNSLLSLLIMFARKIPVPVPIFRNYYIPTGIKQAVSAFFILKENDSNSDSQQ